MKARLKRLAERVFDLFLQSLGVVLDRYEEVRYPKRYDDKFWEYTDESP